MELDLPEPSGGSITDAFPSMPPFAAVVTEQVLAASMFLIMYCRVVVMGEAGSLMIAPDLQTIVPSVSTRA